MAKTKLSREAILESLANQEEPQPAEDGTERTKGVLIKDIYGSDEVGKNGKEYILIVVEYRDLDFDSLQEKKTPMFNRTQAEVLMSMEIGKTYDVKQVKTNGYWDWVEATASE